MIVPRDRIPTPPPERARRSISEESLPQPVGAVVGAFTLKDVIGTGCRGAVYRAEGSGRVVALKVFHPGTALDQESVLPFCPGGQAALRHPNLASIEEIGEVAGCAYYARPFLRGDSLADVMEALERGETARPHLSPLAPARGGGLHPDFFRHAIKLFSEVARGLQAAHERGIFHGRIHPRNLIFSPGGRLVLTDFERSRQEAPQPDAAGAGNGGGEPSDDPARHHWAPEQAAAARAGREVPVGAQTDVYALAAVLYDLVTGYRVREAPRDADGAGGPGGPALPGETGERMLAWDLEAVLLKGLAEDLGIRYATAQAFARDLECLLRLEPTAAAAEARAGGPREESSGEMAAGRADAIAGRIDAGPRTIEDGFDGDVEELAEEAAEEPGGGVEPEEDLAARQLLLEEEYRLPKARARSRRGAWLAAAAFLMLLAASVWISLSLYQTSERHRARARQLDQGLERFEQAVVAISREEPAAAAAALEEARRHVGGRSEVRRIEDRLRSLPGDPLLRGLRDPRPAVRADAAARLLEAVEGGRRPAADLAELSACLGDEALEVRSLAIRACAEAGLTDLLLEAYPAGPGEPALALDPGTFRALYRALGEAAARGSGRALDLLAAIDLESLDDLDRALAASPPPGEAALPPNLRIEIGAGPWAPAAGSDRWARILPAEDGGFVREWLAVHARVDGGAVLERLGWLRERSELTVDLVAALERIGAPAAVRALGEMARDRYLEHGPGIVDALARLRAAEALLELLSQPLPPPLLERAAGRLASFAGGDSRRRAAELVDRHPDPAVRRAALEGLDHQGYYRSSPEALLGPLADPDLRGTALGILERLPVLEALPALLELLGSADAGLRARAIERIGASGSPAALHPLARQLHETDRAVRRAALEALGALGDDRALALAVGILGPGHPGVPELAARVLAAGERREDPQLLAAAILELLGLRSPEGESIGIWRLRRALLRAPLDAEPASLEKLLPERIRRLPGVGEGG